MARYRLLLAYDGTDFHGWQRQEPPGLEPLRTVQGELQRVVQDVVREPLTVVGASRTDAGVHARGQVAAFDAADMRVPLERLPDALNARLPRDIEVRGASAAADDFNPIGGCISKCYSYTLVHGDARVHMPGRAGVFERRFTAAVRPQLDALAMRAAAGFIVGTHDFRAFAHDPDARETTVRTVHTLTVIERAPGLVRVEISGSGFLHHMVRIVVGTLVEVGRGRIVPSDVPAIIAGRERSAAGRTMPPEGLCLEWIHYPAEHGEAAGGEVGGAAPDGAAQGEAGT